MSLFTSTFKNELKKLFKKKKFTVFLILEIILCVLAILSTLGIQKVTNGELSANLFFANLPLTMLRFFLQVYIPLIVIMAVSDLFSGEFSDGTIRSAFMRPVSRLKIYGAKILSVFSVALVYLFVLFVMTTGMKVVTGSFTMASASVLYGFLAYFINLIPLMILILFLTFVVQFSTSPSLSIIVSIILYIGLNILSFIIPPVSGLLFTDYMLWHNLWLGISLPLFPLMSKIMLLVSYGIIFGSMGYYYFEKREV